MWGKERPLKLNFWMVASTSFLQSAILEWANLFGSSRTERHHWERILVDPMGFESSLLAKLSKTKDEYEAECKLLLHFRDKTVAHLDPEARFRPHPQLNVAKACVWHLVEYLFEHEIKGDQVENLAKSFEAFDTEYEKRREEAADIFWKAQGWNFPMLPRDPNKFQDYLRDNPDVLRAITDK
jgi:hypothetical protein